MSENKTYCGIGEVPKNQTRGSMLECAEKKQVKFWGINTVDKKTLQKALLNTTSKAYLNKLKTVVLNLKYDILAMKKKYNKLSNKTEKEALMKTMVAKNEVFLKKRKELMDLETARGQTIVYKKKKPEESTKKATPKPTTSSSKKATTAKKGAPNKWIEHVNAVQKLNKDMPRKLVLQEAKKTYKPLKETVPKPTKKAPKSTKKSSPTLKWLYDAKLDRGPVLPWLNDPVDDDAALKSLYVPRVRGPGAPRGLPKLKKTEILEAIPWLADPGNDPKIARKAARKTAAKSTKKAAPAAPKKTAAKSTKKAAPAAPKKK